MNKKTKTGIATGVGVATVLGAAFLLRDDTPQAPPTPPAAIVRPSPSVTPESPVEPPQQASKHVSKSAAKSMSQEPLPSPLPAPTIPPAVRPELEQGFARIAYPGDRLPVTANVTFIVPPQMIVVINTEGRSTDCLGPRFREVADRQQLDEPYKWNEVLRSIETNKGFPSSICTVRVPEFGYWSFHRCKLDCVEERNRFR